MLYEVITPVVDKGPLPDLLRFAGGEPVKTAADWEARRGELLKQVMVLTGSKEKQPA